MHDHRDRIVDHALRELHGGEPHGDLAERIADAWSRGERGSDLSELELDPPVPVEVPATLPRAHPAPPRRWRVAAAAAVAAAIGAFAWTKLAPLARFDPLRVAVADEALSAWRGSSTVATREPRAGDVAVIGDTSVAALEVFGSGARLVLGPCSVFTFAAERGSTAGALARGAAEVRTLGRAASLDLGGRALALGPNSAATIEIAFDRAELACVPIADARALAAVVSDSKDAPRCVRIRLASGEAWIASDVASESLASGSERELWLPPSPEREVTAAGIDNAARALDAVIAGPKAAYSEFEWAVRARAMASDIAERIAKNPQYWPAVRDETRALVAAEKLDKLTLPRVVDFALAAGGRGFALARELWLVAPQTFREDQIVALADRGAFEFVREVHAMVELGAASAAAEIAMPPDATSVPATPGATPGAVPIATASFAPPPVIAAGWLALRGDARAVELLARTIDDARSPMKPVDLDRVLLAAYVLDMVGRPDAWWRGMDFFSGEIEGLIGRGALPAASTMTLSARMLHEARSEKRWIAPHEFPALVGQYVLAHDTELGDEQAIRATLDRIRR